VAEQPPAKIYGPLNPLVGSSSEFFIKVLDRGDHSLYKNSTQLEESEKRRAEQRRMEISGGFTKSP